ncbi:MAG: calcium-binding protein P [Mediterranea sp.]|jgi:hypothetical protein|nr:calcium-binding protein P [Mediterranea sp.]
MKELVKLALILMIACPLAGTIVSSCAGESDCSTAGRAMLWSSVYRLDGAAAVNDTLDSLTVTALHTDIVLLNKMKDVTRFGLPLKYTNDTTRWVFDYGEQIRDTIVIWYTNTPEFVSMDCGYEMKQVVLGLSYSTRNNRLDSIRVTNTSTNTDETKNLELYFRYH